MFSIGDKICINVDSFLRTLCQTHNHNAREYPALGIDETELNQTEKKHAAGLMRVNHAGEVCAQALYHGQSITAKLTQTREQMQQAQAEEVDHLLWCEKRLKELGSHCSYLNPLWYLGSFSIGAIAGAVGDKWSLGFVAETEKQVVNHLQKHLDNLPSQDKKSEKILEQMKDDENRHQHMAKDAGGTELPRFIQWLMKQTSAVMTKTAYWL